MTMDQHPLLQDLLLDELSKSSNSQSPEKWYDDILTQGHTLPSKILNNISKTGNTNTVTQMVNVLSESEEPTREQPIQEQSTREQPIQDTDDKSNKTVKNDKKNRDTTISFIDAFASNIDEMFSMYSYETKRDIRLYIRDKLIDWVAIHARKFFGPSTSRSISTCLRTRGIMMDDLQKFAELVSFFLDQPIKAGNKVVVWHGFSSSSRDPICELVIKQQGVFVKQL